MAEDAKSVGQTQQILADEDRQKMIAAIQRYREKFTRGDLIASLASLVVATGCVIDKSLLVTRIRTIENEIVTLTNTQVLSTQIINYSAAVRDHAAPLMLHTSITLGYDVPLENLHKALIAAAYATPLILHEPIPVVWQTSLDNSYVSYRLNAYTDQPGLRYEIYSDLSLGRVLLISFHSCLLIRSI